MMRSNGPRSELSVLTLAGAGVEPQAVDEDDGARVVFMSGYSFADGSFPPPSSRAGDRQRCLGNRGGVALLRGTRQARGGGTGTGPRGRPVGAGRPGPAGGGGGRAAININLMAAVRATRSALPSMLAAGKGRS